MPGSTYRHSRILVRTETRPHCRSRPEPRSPGDPVKRWWRSRFRAPRPSAATELWQHAFFFAPDIGCAGTHPAARQCIDWKAPY
ncbi:hypothetical protein F5X71_11290 [Nocardia brasiliensis]|uniref:Uncharacterized protein n=1 Tax=Nocardia brasiliensis TaxID=37326 RepID=A0A6G9XPI0_NOCBR|nr:hypothetical protein [Nocardia brasiliensis]QIS02825.1 hypothetical protein F5X71_11290 [Nocardia brasiliensis]